MLRFLTSSLLEDGRVDPWKVWLFAVEDVFYC